MPSFDKAKFESSLKRVGNELNSDPHHRLLSWDHAHIYWQKYINGESNDQDHAALQLAFYLASWGMYRGSSDLLNRDYKVLLPAVSYLHKEARTGWADCIFSDKTVKVLVYDLNELAQGLCDQLRPGLTSPGKKTANVSDTLLSKILLNTLSCVPGFDSEVKAGLKSILADQYPIGYAFSERRMTKTIELARENRSLIEEGRQIMKKTCGIDYPLTKILDLFLWRQGHASRRIAKNPS